VNPTAGGLKSKVKCDPALVVSSKGWPRSKVTSLGFLQGASKSGRLDRRGAPLLFVMQPYTSRFDLLGASKIRNGCEGSCWNKMVLLLFQG